MTERKEETLAWEEVECEHLITDEWIDFRRSKYRFPDGSEFEPFYSYSRKNFVVVVASDTEGNLICVRQFRQGIGEVTLEFCAGGIEAKDGGKTAEGKKDGGRDALAAAKRELLEETGYVSEEWTHLLTVPSNPTMADNYAHLFMAKNCKKAGSQKLDDTEFLHVVKLSEKELFAKIRQGAFQQPIHILGWLLARQSTADMG